MLLIVSDGHSGERSPGTHQGSTRSLGTVHYGQAHCVGRADIAGSRQLAHPHRVQTVQSRACQDSAAVIGGLRWFRGAIWCIVHAISPSTPSRTFASTTPSHHSRLQRRQFSAAGSRHGILEYCFCINTILFFFLAACVDICCCPFCFAPRCRSVICSPDDLWHK
jgi:hypothetical protein